MNHTTTSPKHYCGVCGTRIEDANIYYSDRVTTRDYSTAGGTAQMPCHGSCINTVLEGKVVIGTQWRSGQAGASSMTTKAEHFETMRSDPSRGQLTLIERHLAEVAGSS